MSKKKRVSIFVDGFNLYHAIDALNDNSLKWLDLRLLAEQLIGEDEYVGEIKYFSAYAKWMPAGYRRHQRYVAALIARDVEFIEGRFKKKHISCKDCGEKFITHEEKETDVNIGVHLIHDTLKKRFDRALIISADTDLNSAVAMARKNARKQIIDIVAPTGRKNHNHMSLFAISRTKLNNSLLPSMIVSKDGREIIRPEEYNPEA